MKEIEIFLHGLGIDNVERIHVSENATIVDILKIAKEKRLIPGESYEVMDIFIEGQDEPVHKGHSLHHLGIKDRANLICHHCKKVEVTILHNSDVKSNHFFPTTKVGVVLKWAIHAFGISGQDVVPMVLRIEGTKNDLPEDLRIGALVHYPHCHLKLYLTPKKRVEG